ncbi:hypothetical protein PT2222_140207 [Paraburkholderia tropica]
MHMYLLIFFCFFHSHQIITLYV